MSEVKTCIEDILGPFGFRLSWFAYEASVSVKVYEIVGRLVPDDAALFYRKDWTTSTDQTTKINEADVYLDGFIKWDGCSQFDVGRLHFDGPADFKNHWALLRHLWHRAFELMGHPPDEAWGESSSEKPTKPGHYWHRRPGKGSASVREIDEGLRDRWTREHVADLPGEWSGPLEPPA